MTDAEIHAMRQELGQLREENRLLRQKVDLLIRQMFGRKSEKLTPGQLELLLGDESPGRDAEEASAGKTAPEEAPKPRKRQPRKPRFPEDLPVEEEILDPEPVKADPEQWRLIGEEVSEQLDYVRARFLRRRQVRRTWVKRNAPDAAPVTAGLPPKLLERGILAPGLLAHIVISKYADHLPLYRQEKIFRERHGVHLGRNTLCRGVELVADWLKPIADHMFREQCAGGYLQLDETPVSYLSPGRGKTAKGYLWVAHVPQGDTVYHWAPGRGREHVKNWLPDKLDCVIQTDDYAVYNQLEVSAHASCWAHARRKFIQAREQGEHPARVGWILHQISLLYAVERRLREAHAGPNLRQAVRQHQSRPIIDRLFRCCRRLLATGEHKPRSLAGTAIGYLLRLEAGLRVYLDHGRVEIDNNLVENAIRPAALGRKNWMFIGDEEAGWRSAVIYTILQSCKTHGVEPTAYLRDVLERLPYMTNQQIPTVTPKAWAKDQAARKVS